MDIWYDFTGFILPFGWAGHTFMKNALLAVILVTPVLGALGTMIINNRMAFFSDALGHSALTGIAAGVIAGLASPLWSMLAFSVLLAISITFVRRAGKASADTVIGVFSSSAVALGIVILSRSGGFAKYSAYLIGDILSITPSDIYMLFFMLAITVIFWILLFNKLLLTGVNVSIAKSKGINARFMEYAFAAVMAVVVTLSIQWIGILVISSLLILPAAAARNVTRNARSYTFFSVVIALVSGISGLIASYFAGTSSGATIVLVSSAFFALTFAAGQLQYARSGGHDEG